MRMQGLCEVVGLCPEEQMVVSEVKIISEMPKANQTFCCKSNSSPTYIITVVVNYASLLILQPV
jgi:hypothetical protein